MALRLLSKRIGASSSSFSSAISHRFAFRAGFSSEPSYDIHEPIKSQANFQNPLKVHADSLKDPDAFWADFARTLHWEEPWNKVSEFNSETYEHKWFLGGKTNIVYNALDRWADSGHRNVVALIWVGENGEEKKLTYIELRDMVARFAAGLRTQGVKKGDRVCIYMPLTVEAVVSMMACARIGAVHCVVFAGLGVEALKQRIVDSGAEVVIASDISYRRGKASNLSAIVDQATMDLTQVRKIIKYRRGKESVWNLAPHRDLDWYDLLEANPRGVPCEFVDSEHPLYLLHTSGSTGKPKGILHVHNWQVGVAYHMKNLYDAKQGDIWWATSDVGWIVGHAYITYAPLIQGVTSLFREGAPDTPTPDIWWKIIEKYRVTSMFAAPTVLRLFMKMGEKHLEGKDLSSLRLLSVAGEVCNPEVYEWAHRHIGGGDVKTGKPSKVAICDNWWQTELGGPTIATPAVMDARPGVAGIAMPGVDIDVVDNKGNTVAPGDMGKLIIRKPFPHFMRGVWNDAERYKKYFTELIPGVYSAGDEARKFADGYIQICGRSDDVLKIAGHRIGTGDVENALVSHPAVAEAAVIGLPDQVKGEVAKAFVVLRATAVAQHGGQKEKIDVLRDSIAAHLRRDQGAAVVLDSIEFVDALPKTRSGKILRRVLKAKELGLPMGDVSTIEE